MKIETKKNIGDRLFKVVEGGISFFDIEGIEIRVSSNNYISVKYTLRRNLTTGYRNEVYEENLKDYYDSPEEAAKAVLDSFVLSANDED